MSDLWPQKLLDDLPYPGPTTGWLADPSNAPAWWTDVRLSRFRPTQVSGCVLWLDPRVTDGIVLANATITDGANLHSATWTHTNVTPVYNQDGLGGTQFTVSSTTTPRATQSIANSGVSLTAQPPCTITVKYKAGTAPFLLIESVASAANRTWVNLSTHAVGTSGANHSGGSVSAPDSLGYRTVSMTMNANALGTTPNVRLQLVSADNVTTGASVGQTIWLKEATVDQPRIAAYNNLATGVASSFAQGTVNNQPGYEAAGINGQAAIRSYVAASATQYLASTEAAVMSLFSGDDTPWYMAAVVLPRQTIASESSSVFSAYSGASDNLSALLQDNGGIGPWAVYRRSGAGSIEAEVSTTHGGTGTPQVIEAWFTGSQVFISKDGGTPNPNGTTSTQGAQSPAAMRLMAFGTSAGARMSLGATVAFSRVPSNDERSWIRQGLARGGPSPYGISVAA
jgi:hypothetical protein